MMRWLPAHRRAMIDPYEPFVVWTSREVADQTVRQVIRAGRGGSRFRLWLSNRYGRRPLTIAEAVAAGGDRGVYPLRFGDAPGVTVPAGADVVTDPVPVAVADGEDITVSLYLPERTGLATYHPAAHRTGYLAPGNQVGAATLRDAQPHTALHWLSGLDVAATEDTPLTIVTFGDSLTDGDASSLDTARTYPDQLAARLRRHPPTTNAAVINTGLAGNKLLTDTPGEAALRRAEHDIFAVPSVSHVIVHLGLNDIGQPAVPGGSPATAEQVIRGLTTLARRARERGIAPIAGTLTPLPDASRDGAEHHSEPARQAINTWIRHTPEFIAVIDFDAALADPTNPARLRPDYDSGDGVHPNDAGAQAMADAVDPQTFTHRCTADEPRAPP
jgi:lysophospholipase L1-like esterase